MPRGIVDPVLAAYGITPDDKHKERVISLGGLVTNDIYTQLRIEFGFSLIEPVTSSFMGANQTQELENMSRAKISTSVG